MRITNSYGHERVPDLCVECRTMEHYCDLCCGLKKFVDGICENCEHEVPELKTEPTHKEKMKKPIYKQLYETGVIQKQLRKKTKNAQPEQGGPPNKKTESISKER